MAVRRLAVTYGSVVPGLRDVSLEVRSGAILAVLGANGAGKTSLLRAVSGLLSCHRGAITHGSVELDGRRVDRLDPAAIARLGVRQVLEGGRVFPQLSVEENLATGALSKSRAAAAASRAQVLELFPLLAPLLSLPAGALSGGQQQLLALGRALMSEPTLLLLDEPSRGLAPALRDELRRAIIQTVAGGATVVLVEQHAEAALSIADDAVVLEDGTVRLAGTAATLRDHPEVRRAYLGDRVAPGSPRHPAEPADARLEVENVTLRFGPVTALDGVSFTVGRNEVVAVIGPNGAGKTSLLNCLNQAYVAPSGSIRLEGHELVGLRPAQVASLGVARAFQAPTGSPSLTVLDTILLGRHRLMQAGTVAALVRTRRARREEAAHRHRCREVAAQLGLQRWLDRPVGGLPYGVQKRVELARAVAMEPVLLLVDEPGSGVSAAEVDEVAEALANVRTEGDLSVVIVEHDLRLVGLVADRVIVMDGGRVLSIGTPDAVRSDPEVVRAYVGT